MIGLGDFHAHLMFPISLGNIITLILKIQKSKVQES